MSRAPQQTSIAEVAHRIHREGGLPVQSAPVDAWLKRHAIGIETTYRVLDLDLSVVIPATRTRYDGSVCAVLFLQPGTAALTLRFNSNANAPIPILQEGVIERHYAEVWHENTAAGGAGARAVILLDRDLRTG